MMEGRLELEDGTVYHGVIRGALQAASGEVVFQTGMVGYVESLTDPSYHGQILVLTYPLIGNYGVPGDEIDDYGLSKWMESRKIWPIGVVVGELCQESRHWNEKLSLEEWLKEQNIPIIEGIDTRALTMRLRESGTVAGKILTRTSDINSPFITAGSRNLTEEVSIKVPSPMYNNKGTPRILVIDCGLKNNQLRCLISRGSALQVFPWNCDIGAEMDNFDGLFISSGPGDPKLSTQLISNLAAYMTSPKLKPIFGICMGHQMVALAAGLQTYRLRYGNRGHNQPCIHAGTGRCFITSQNHGYAVDVQNLPVEWKILFTNANDGTNEGIVHAEKPIFTVQFHPEHNAGPADTEWLFDVFLDCAEQYKNQDLCAPLSDLLNDKMKTPPAPCPVSVFKPRKALILGSGGLTIGQAGEFDYCGAQAIKALKDEDVNTVLINPNVATSQTTKGLADTVYFLPVDVNYVTQVIKAERPDGILLNFGGQTALNCGVKLVEEGVLDRYNVKVLGTPVQVIIWTEDRKLFADKLAEIGYCVAPSAVAYSVEDALNAAKTLGFPLLVRAAYSLGGLNSGFAENREQLIDIATRALCMSEQIFIDKSLKGWKELEYEVVRDVFDNCITVCNMENIDPLGIHTGDSVVVAPSQTLTDREFQMLRTASIRVIRHLGVVGECNIQYALDPNSHEFFIVEVNARLSRSSALASKATGYPLAFIAAKLAIGHSLVELRNPVTSVTTACFEPSLDYCVVKIPRWDLRKFSGVSSKIGSAMKSIGECMAIGRGFEEAFQQALRMVDEDNLGFDPHIEKLSEEELKNPSDKRMLMLATAFAEGYTIDQLQNLTKINYWFLAKMKRIHDFRVHLTRYSDHDSRPMTREVMLTAKKLGFCDRQIAGYLGTTKQVIRTQRKNLGIHPWVKQIDTVAGEWPAFANYLYTTYHSQQHDVTFSSGYGSSRPAIMVLGSGVYRIGSSVEFDCCAVGCLAEIRRLGRRTIMINCNPETVSTDYDVCDRLYFEEISAERVMDIYELENPEGIILSMGGQLPNNIAMKLHRLNAVILGTSPESIDSAENRFKFSRLLDTVGILQPKWEELTNLESAHDFCATVQYPCLIRPSYVLSGAAMQIAYSARDLETYLGRDAEISTEYPVVISKFVENAREIDVDAVAADGTVVCMAISEHVENAGVHSGDATLITPPQNLDADTLEQIREITMNVAEVLEANGPLNLQLLLKDKVLLVIECNLRVSRSFPFVSKTHDYDFVVTATRVALGEKVDPVDLVMSKDKRIGVKVAMFSFARLPSADVSLGVEMRSTGEVAGYGKDKYEAFLKGIISAGFVFPQPGGKVFLGISSLQHREELTGTVCTLGALGYKLFGNPGTADYYRKNGIIMEEIEWISDINQLCKEHHFCLAISIPTLKGSTPRMSIDSTMGHLVSRTAADYNIPLITNITYAKVLVGALQRYPTAPLLRLGFDNVNRKKFVSIPGLIDVNAHVQEMTAASGFSTASSHALSNGITLICCNPQSAAVVAVPEFDIQTMKQTAEMSCHCDYGLIVGVSVDGTTSLSNLAKHAIALGMTVDHTVSSGHILEDMTAWHERFSQWPKTRPICYQCDRKTLPAVLLMSHFHSRNVHISQVTSKEEISLIKDAKRKGIKVTCDVSVLNLFLTSKNLDISGTATPDHQADLWANLEWIDCFASGLTLFNKSNGQKNSIPSANLEIFMPLLLTAVHDGRLTVDDIVRKCYENPRRIFDLPEQPDTYVELDMTSEWQESEKSAFFCHMELKPLMERSLFGKVHRVVLRGEEAFIDGQITAQAGTGMDVSRVKHREGIRGRPNLISSKSFDTIPVIAVDGDTEEQEPVSAMPDRTTKGRLDPKTTTKSSRRLSFDVGQTKEDLDTVFKFTPSSNSGSTGSVDLTTNQVTVTGRRASYPLIPAPTLAFPFRHVIDIEDFHEPQLDYLFGLAKSFQTNGRKGRVMAPLLAGRVLALLFQQGTQRSISAYATAMQRLGGTVVYVDSATSSLQKGESLSDTVTIMASYCDAIVLKQSEADFRDIAACCGLKPLINAGDASGEDITEALSDAFTIWDELGTLNGLTVTFVGNLKHGSVVHSLIKLFACRPFVGMRFVGGLYSDLPEHIRKILQDHGVEPTVYDTIKDAMPETNILYIGKMESEDFPSQADYENSLKTMRLTPHTMNLGRKEKRTGPKLRVLHALPRSALLPPELDSDSRVTHFRQAENGLYVRMALLASLVKSQGMEGQLPGSAATAPMSDTMIQTVRQLQRARTDSFRKSSIPPSS